MFLPLKADSTVRLFSIKINGGNKSTLTGQKTSKGQLSMLTTLERLSPFSHLKMFEKHSSLSTLPQEMLIDGTIYFLNVKQVFLLYQMGSLVILLAN